MAKYSLRLKSPVEKELRRLPVAERQRCLERIGQLADDPRPRGISRIIGSQCSYRLRVGTYRVVFQVDDDLRVVTVEHVRHRKDAYR